MAKTEVEKRREGGLGHEVAIYKGLFQQELGELVPRGPQIGFPWSVIMHKGQEATTATREEREPRRGPGFGSNKQLGRPHSKTLQSHQIPCC